MAGLVNVAPVLTGDRVTLIQTGNGGINIKLKEKQPMVRRNNMLRPLNLVKRGRPEIEDREVLKSKIMSICLTKKLHERLVHVADDNNQRPATMARILIETGMQDNAD